MSTAPFTQEELEALRKQQYDRIEKMAQAIYRQAGLPTSFANELGRMAAKISADSARLTAVIDILTGRKFMTSRELAVIFLQALYNCEKAYTEGAAPLVGGLTPDDFARMAATLQEEVMGNGGSA